MIEKVAARLAAAGCVAAGEEAAELVLAAPDAAALEGWIARREDGEPLAWITGTMRFGDVQLRLETGVYVPRLQSEELARRAATLTGPGGRAADLCTGSGAVAAHLLAACPRSRIVGVDRDPRAAACARRNGVRVVVGDLGAPLATGAFDVVTAVAPYVPTGALHLLPADVQRYEPRLALDGGPDGLALVRRLVADARRLLRTGGWLVLEIGGDQDEGIAPTLATNGFGPPSTWRDDDGDLRGMVARRIQP